MWMPIEGAEPDDSVIGALAARLAPGEEPLVAARCLGFEFSGRVEDAGAQVLITSSRLMAGKQKLFGGGKEVASIELSELRASGCGPLRGVGPTWAVTLQTTRGAPGSIHFPGPREAEAFEQALRRAVTGGLPPDPPEPPVAAAGGDGDRDALLDHLHDLADALRPMATQDMLGVPFGEGCGLEQAVGAAQRAMPDEDALRASGRVMCIEVLANTHDDQLPADMTEAMGATPEAVARHALSPAQADAVLALGGAARELLAQHGQPGSLWDLWERRADVAAEMLCWHLVARLRLATAGRMPPVVRP